MEVPAVVQVCILPEYICPHSYQSENSPMGKQRRFECSDHVAEVQNREGAKKKLTVTNIRVGSESRNVLVKRFFPQL
jgi:hypothetical protein